MNLWAVCFVFEHCIIESTGCSNWWSPRSKVNWSILATCLNVCSCRYLATIENDCDYLMQSWLLVGEAHRILFPCRVPPWAMWVVQWWVGSTPEKTGMHVPKCNWFMTHSCQPISYPGKFTTTATSTTPVNFYTVIIIVVIQAVDYFCCIIGSRIL